MAMAAVGLSTTLKNIKTMGYKPFVVGFITMITVGLVNIITMQSFTKLFYYKKRYVINGNLLWKKIDYKCYKIIINR